jgi:hypothetical protein
VSWKSLPDVERGSSANRLKKQPTETEVTYLVPVLQAMLESSL